MSYRSTAGVSLTAFNFATRKKLWRRSKTSVDTTIRTHDSKPAYRDLKLDGKIIWAACICDAVNANPDKALVKLDIEGNHESSRLTEAGEAARGARGWVPDTSCSAQAVYNGRLEVWDASMRSQPSPLGTRGSACSVSG